MADPPASLALAAAAGESALKEAVQGALSLPHYQGPRIPTSWSEAQAIAQARDEARLKQKETNSKSKGHKPQFQAQDPAQTQPGVSIGSIGDAAPFWMFVVRPRTHVDSQLRQVTGIHSSATVPLALGLVSL
jgi:hypothetical protein